MQLPLVDGEEEAPLSVSELVDLISGTLESHYSATLVMGELTNFSTPMSGHRYFTLSDDAAAIDCVMWRSDAQRLGFRPEVGDEVVCRGRVGVYPKQGRMQLYVSAMKPVGAGAAQKAFEELKRRLQGEGLFAAERKRPLPFLPRTIGVVTSRSGAAVHDILVTLARRFPGVGVVVAAASVQGEQAAAELVAALRDLAALGRCDVVIVGRGGGASEDLAAFNEEPVVRAIAAFPVPVVSAVGHEVDVSLSDLAADYRAATPTAAAEAVVPVHAELVDELAGLAQRLATAAGRAIENRRYRVDAVAAKLRDPAARVAALRQTVDRIGTRLERSLLARHSASATSLAALESKLGALDPLAVLERGYALVRRPNGSVVRSGAELAAGDVLDLRFRSGGARAQVLSSDSGETGA